MVQAICTFISCAFVSHMCPCLSLVITMWPQSLVSSSEAAEAALAPWPGRLLIDGVTLGRTGPALSRSEPGPALQPGTWDTQIMAQ